MTDRPTTLMKRRLNLWINLLIIVLIVYIVFSIFKTSVTESDKWRELADSQQLKVLLFRRQGERFMTVRIRCLHKAPQCIRFTAIRLCSGTIMFQKKMKK